MNIYICMCNNIFENQPTHTHAYFFMVKSVDIHNITKQQQHQQLLLYI